jgi:Protein of unknown function (DUF2934)
MKPKDVSESNQTTGQQIISSEAVRAQNGPSLEEIQQRAYEIHIERGGTHGQDVDDWLTAERELQEKYRAG